MDRHLATQNPEHLDSGRCYKRCVQWKSCCVCKRSGRNCIHMLFEWTKWIPIRDAVLPSVVFLVRCYALKYPNSSDQLLTSDTVALHYKPHSITCEKVTVCSLQNIRTEKLLRHLAITCSWAACNDGWLVLCILVLCTNWQRDQSSRCDQISWCNQLKCNAHMLPRIRNMDNDFLEVNVLCTA